MISNYRVDHNILKKSGINIPVHLIEASRGCNFKCDFCAIPAERAKHATYGIETVADNINNSIQNSPLFSFRRIYPIILFIDNNLSNDISYMKALCDYLRKEKKVKCWGGLITQNILKDKEIIKLMAKSKCICVFTGIESFDIKFLELHDKSQNIVNLSSIINDIRFAQEQGIVVTYGYLLDPRITSVAEMKKEIKTILESDVIISPPYFGFILPLLGTNLFWESVKNKELLPNLRVRDLEGNTIVWNKSIDDIKELSDFARTLYRKTHLIYNKMKLAKKTMKSIVNFGFNPLSSYLIYRNNFRVFHETQHTQIVDRNYTGGEDLLDPSYYEYPENITLEDKEKYFDPIMITDEKGNLSQWLKDYIPKSSLSLHEISE